jgi:glucan 1,3-beta-glucosidase
MTNEKTDNDQKQPWIRGVNIGGWLVLERFITPYFFALTDCHLRGDFHFYPNQIDAPPASSPIYKLMDEEALSKCKPVQPYPVEEYTLTSAFSDKEIAKAYMTVHWDNFVKRDDIRKLKETGVTHIRVPLGHWIMGDIREGEPWVDGGWKYFKRLVDWCREDGIEVWPDIHTAPGSQNGFDNSGQLLDRPTCHGWDMDDASIVDTEKLTHGHGKVKLSNNVLRSLKAVDDITSTIARDNMTDVVTGKKSNFRINYEI